MTRENTMDASKQLIAVQGHIEEAGAIVWWRLSGPINYALLREKWLAAGLAEESLPSIPSMETCLRRAVQSHQRRRYRVRPTEVGWVFVEETAQGDDVAFRTDLKVRIEGENVVCDPPAHQLASAITAETGVYRVELAATDAGSWLVDLVYDVQAVPLRDGGGVYFVPKSSLDQWNRILSVIREVSEHSISEVRALKSEEAVAAITDAITRDAESVFERISKELQESLTGDAPLGERAIETRQERLREVADKLATYETLLGVRLDAMRARMEKVAGALALGHLVS